MIGVISDIEGLSKALGRYGIKEEIEKIAECMLQAEGIPKSNIDITTVVHNGYTRPFVNYSVNLEYKERKEHIINSLTVFIKEL